MDLDLDPSRLGCTLQHPREPSGRERSPALTHEHKGARWSFPLKPSERPHLPAGQRMRAGRTRLGPTDVQDSVVEVHLLPSQVQLARRPVGRAGRPGGPLWRPGEPNGCLWCLDELLDLLRREVFTGPQVGIGTPHRDDCSIYGGRRYQPQAWFFAWKSAPAQDNCREINHNTNSPDRASSWTHPVGLRWGSKASANGCVVVVW